MKILKKVSAILLILAILFSTSCVVLAEDSQGRILSSSAFVLDGKVVTDIVSEGFKEKDMAIAALLDNEDKVLCISSSKIKDEFRLEFPENKLGTKVRIFLWGGLMNMQPLCEVVVTKVENPFYGKKLYVDGDSICYGNGYKGGFGKIIADMYGMELVNKGVGGATICSGTCYSPVKYYNDDGTVNTLDWENAQYYLTFTHCDPENPYEGSEYMDGAGIPLTKEIYENGYGVYPTLYKLVDGILVEQEYTEELPQGKRYIRFEQPTYDGNTVPKYTWITYWVNSGTGEVTGSHWLWEAYKSGFAAAHKKGDARLGTARHRLSESVESVDTAADYVVFEGGINDYLVNRRLGELTIDMTGEVDTTTVIGGMEYICRQLLTKCAGKKIVYVITHKSKTHAWTKNRLGGARDYKTWEEYHDAIISVLKKYNIDYVDLFETEFDTSKEEYLQYTVKNDGVHPTKEGYEKFYVPYIVEAMKK